MKGGGAGAILVLVLLLGIWKLMHIWWFWVIVLTIAGAIWYYFYLLGAPRRAYLARQAQKPKWVPPATTARPPQAAAGPTLVIGDDYVECRNFMARQDWDAARRVLQGIAYSMPDKTPEVKAKFTALMKEFAARDPLVGGVLRIAMPMIRDQPGMLQTAMYKHLPGIGPEEARYAFYFAEQLGILRREKKGNTYRLLPAGEVITLGAEQAGITINQSEVKA